MAYRIIIFLMIFQSICFAKSRGEYDDFMATQKKLMDGMSMSQLNIPVILKDIKEKKELYKSRLAKYPGHTQLLERNLKSLEQLNEVSQQLNACNTQDRHAFSDTSPKELLKMCDTNVGYFSDLRNVVQKTYIGTELPSSKSDPLQQMMEIVGVTRLNLINSAENEIQELEFALAEQEYKEKNKCPEPPYFKQTIKDKVVTIEFSCKKKKGWQAGSKQTIIESETDKLNKAVTHTNELSQRVNELYKSNINKKLNTKIPMNPKIKPLPCSKKYYCHVDIKKSKKRRSRQFVAHFEYRDYESDNPEHALKLETMIKTEFTTASKYDLGYIYSESRDLQGLEPGERHKFKVGNSTRSSYFQEESEIKPLSSDTTKELMTRNIQQLRAIKQQNIEALESLGEIAKRESNNENIKSGRSRTYHMEKLRVRDDVVKELGTLLSAFPSETSLTVLTASDYLQHFCLINSKIKSSKITNRMRNIVIDTLGFAITFGSLAIPGVNLIRGGALLSRTALRANMPRFIRSSFTELKPTQRIRSLRNNKIAFTLGTIGMGSGVFNGAKNIQELQEEVEANTESIYISSLGDRVAAIKQQISATRDAEEEKSTMVKEILASGAGVKTPGYFFSGNAFKNIVVGDAEEEINVPNPIEDIFSNPFQLPKRCSTKKSEGLYHCENDYIVENE